MPYSGGMARRLTKPRPAQGARLVALRKDAGLFDAFFAKRDLRVIEVSASVIERATELRARYGLKTPDALHTCHGASRAK